MTPEAALAYWYRALDEEIGIILTFTSTDDRRVFMNALYEARASAIAADPTLETLSLAKPGDAPNELWIIKKTTDLTDIR